MREFEESKKLTNENYLLRRLSALISEALQNGDASWINDGYELAGDLTFYDNYKNE